jgi:hypothetical protein
VLSMKITEYQRINLKVMVLWIWLRRFKNITDPANSVDHLSDEILVHLVS